MKRVAVAFIILPLTAACAGSGDADLAARQPSASPTSQSTPAEEVIPARTGPLSEGVAASRCVEEYSAATIGNRDFAFDGTVVNIGSGGTNKPGKGEMDTAAVTFRVNEWFKGGTDATVTVDFGSVTGSVGPDQPPAYEAGTRLLVSGEPRWGGEPLEDAIAWSCGGFTRYYEAPVAEEWRRATA